MREYPALSDSTQGALARFDRAAEWLLVGLLAFMPFAFGVVHAWSEEIVIILCGAIVICFLLKLMCQRDETIIWTWAYVPLGVFLLIPIIQLIRLPATLVRIISPNTAALKTELLSDLPKADALLKSMPLSFYPYATKHDLRLVLAVGAVFVVVLNVFRRPDRIKRLLMAIAVIGGVIAAVALVQDLFGNGKIYWFITVSSCRWRGYSGPFVNYSNFAQFMNLSIGAALGLLLVRLHERFAGEKVTSAAIVRYLHSDSAKPIWLLGMVIILAMTTVSVSLSRGGVVIMFISMTLTTLLLVRRRSLKGVSFIIVAMALIAFTGVLCIGFDVIYDRLGTLRDPIAAAGSRPQILKDIAAAWTKFPMLGTGLGTHAVVYPMFDHSTVTALAAHAENEYAQALEETGLIGLASLVIFGMIIWSSYARNIRSNRLAICSAAYGLGFGILAILIHSFSDFGQHLPANAILSAVLCALILALAQQGQNRRRTLTICTPLGRFMCTVVLLGVSGIWIWIFVGANDARVAEGHWKKALAVERELISNDWQGTEAEYADLISHASAAADYQPENIKYRHWLNVYRWRSISQAIDASGGEIVIPEHLTPSIRDIVAEFHKARLVCPTYGLTYGVVGQIEKFVLGDDSGAERIRKSYRLAPCNPRVCFLAGYTDLMEGKYEDCVEKFARAAQLDDMLFTNVIGIYVDYLSRPHLAIAAAGNDVGQLHYVANILEDFQYNDLAEQAREKIEDLLEGQRRQSDAPASTIVYLANVCRRRQDNEAAIECYRHALALDYGQVDWRLELTRLLVETGRIREAMREARICLQLRPESKEAERLVADLSVHPLVIGEDNLVPKRFE